VKASEARRDIMLRLLTQSTRSVHTPFQKPLRIPEEGQRRKQGFKQQ